MPSNTLKMVGALWLLTAPCWAATFEEKVVASVILAEARGEGIQGMTAVGEVIANRARERRKTAVAVVLEPWQFSCLNRTTPKALVAKFETHKYFNQALIITRTIAQEPHRLPRLTRGADHYDSIERQPAWAKGKRPIAVVGNHQFWRIRS